MEQNNINFFRSISGRITIQVLLVCAMVFLFSFIIFFEISVKKVENETVLHAHSELSSTISKIENILLSLEVAVQNTSFQVEEHLKNPESLYEITQKLVSANYFISGSAIAFEPYYFKDKGEYFSPYSYMDSEGKIQTIQMGGFDYDYHHMDWYLIPKLLGKPYWSEPYYDAGGGEMMMTT